ncbi:co-chaperone GroES [Patescibacteria group bacterium]|nr:co-chaperone GroES [Patescibacteria group bacterium]MBU1500746.1 co-chaperone GroES [Patescibacteria group bacterium]MBU2080801.1 co-chaperone GroES [Patescibacteria group bacterium]MBU2123906.1 co-chaperone GroES [Patescibacteria group bacterium]MBU2194803.1 co-chaperone GroES [Patescibacteria group bacterium]
MAKAARETLSITPLGDRVVVQPLKKDEVSAMGIILPDTGNREKPERGTIVAVGKGRTEDGKLIPLSVKIGDTVLFSKYGFDEVKIDGQEYFILSESNVLAVIQ